MTTDELLAAINAANLSAADLASVLSFGSLTVQREKLASAIRAERTSQAAAVQASEGRIQALQAQLDAINTQLEQAAGA